MVAIGHQKGEYRLMLLYKIQYHIVAVTSELYLTASDSRARRAHSVQVPPSRIEGYRASFFPRIWTGTGSQQQLPTKEARRSVDSSWVG